MKNIKLKIATVLIAASLPTIASANYNILSGEVQIAGSLANISEFRNAESTDYFSVGIKQEIPTGKFDYMVREHGKVFASALYQDNNHPSSSVDGEHIFVGGGFENYDGFGVETLFSKDEFRIAPYYHTSINKVGLKGELIFQDGYTENRSKTGLKGTIDYEIVDNIKLGGSYHVRNVEREYTDDQLELHVNYSW